MERNGLIENRRKWYVPVLRAPASVRSMIRMVRMVGVRGWNPCLAEKGTAFIPLDFSQYLTKPSSLADPIAAEPPAVRPLPRNGPHVPAELVPKTGNG